MNNAFNTDKILTIKKAAQFLNVPIGSDWYRKRLKQYSVDKRFPFRLPYYELSSGRGYKIQDLEKFRELSQRKEPNTPLM